MLPTFTSPLSIETLLNCWLFLELSRYPPNLGLPLLLLEIPHQTGSAMLPLTLPGDTLLLLGSP
ncbi:hypothetical protein DSO57_1011859 [Entomophthora muscae]|uniref:Uncharacterized protein n=1 Tax=Entomophthora muscae TaxID=34485 RepID=A0ACC2S863_9FUNG|nr:hypothetical protein DSO57_1011859 [Entomophthora muscae]